MATEEEKTLGLCLLFWVISNRLEYTWDNDRDRFWNSSLPVKVPRASVNRTGKKRNVIR
ncbi:hypothetical protein PROFUN_16341 [Planoprotostelium fungivorum]|uniref:Uncharacterized protein n=1 Tax=Planoprotostelium fungivorum TaxID=1890364 RepID=A0A2P6MRA5_9EUKA|nr:hypothetical protein PROFUN_16341 [Planoprotostelium fungivorum]